MKDEILNKYFYQDGSLRDIFILESQKSDWDILLDHFDSNPDISFDIFKDGEKYNKEIRIEEILKLKMNHSIYIQINYRGICISGYFTETEFIEFDITPREIITLKEVDSLIEFMIIISKITNKEVILTSEMNMTEIYIRIITTGETIFCE